MVLLRLNFVLSGTEELVFPPLPGLLTTFNKLTPIQLQAFTQRCVQHDMIRDRHRRRASKVNHQSLPQLQIHESTCISST